MATQLSSISGLTTGVNNLSNLILVNPQTNIGYYQQSAPVPAGVDQPDQNVSGFLFDYEGENSIQLEADITDHFVENNSTISDQISIRPEVVTVQGFVGEVNDIFPAVDTLLNVAKSKLTTLSAYAPEASTSALVAINTAILAYQVAAKAVGSAQQSIATLTGGKVQNKQQLAFNKFYQAFQNRVLFTIQTPWVILNNMAIRSLRAIQSADTRMITDFEIQFKKINYVALRDLTAEQQERALSQYSEQVNLGSHSTNEASIPVSDIYGNLGGRTA
jgi:hypothetical protein